MANKYLHASGGTGNWSDSTGTWRTTDQGATVAAAPTASDVAICTVNAGARTLTVDTNSCVAQQLNCNGFVGTLAIGSNNQLSITTNITFGSGMTFTSSGRLRAGAGTATLNFNGVAIAGDFEFFGTGTKTLSANTTVSGITYMSASPTINGNTWYAVGGIEATTAANKIWYGSTNVEIQGGRWYYITKRTGGKVILNGNVTLQSGYSTSTMGIYDSTLSYTAGTITVATDSIFNINGTSTIESNVGSNVVFQHLDMAGVLTINSDIYVAKKISSIGTTSITINGAYTIHFGYGGNANANLIMYNLGNFKSTTAKLSFEGSSGTLFSGTHYNGMTFQPLNALNMSMDINSPGTATFNNGAANRFGNGGTLTWVAGTVVTTGCTWQPTTGNYTFNIDTLVPTFDIATTGITATLSSDFDCTTFRQIAGSTLSIATTKTFTIGTNFYVNGTDSTTTTISSAGTGVIDYNGTMANCKIFKGTFTNIDASPSAIVIYSWYGSESGCTNVEAVTGADFASAAVGSYGVSVSIF